MYLAHFAGTCTAYGQALSVNTFTIMLLSLDRKNLQRFFFWSTSSNQKNWRCAEIFLSLKELIDLTKSVVPDVKDPCKQQGEALANFFFFSLRWNTLYFFDEIFLVKRWNLHIFWQEDMWRIRKRIQTSLRIMISWTHRVVCN